MTDLTHELLEERSKNLARNKIRLHKRLREALSCLLPEVRKKFNDYVFDFDNKCFTTKDGTMRLQWRLRLFPDQPPGYMNQQTNCGVVVLEHLPINLKEPEE